MSKNPRLDRETWLINALEVLSRDGESKIRIEPLCERLGVTKGSFYWHFRDRADFLEAILEYWTHEFNRRVYEAVAAHGGPPEDRLRFLVRMVTAENLGRFDIALEAWAAHEPAISSRIREVFKSRNDFVKTIFSELGFRGIALEIRVSAFLGSLMSELRLTGKNQFKRSHQRIEKEVRFFTRPD